MTDKTPQGNELTLKKLDKLIKDLDKPTLKAYQPTIYTSPKNEPILKKMLKELGL